MSATAPSRGEVTMQLGMVGLDRVGANMARRLIKSAR